MQRHSPFLYRVKDLFGPEDDPIKVHLPDLSQHENYTCGASAMEAICEFFGVGPETEEEFMRLLDSDPEEGTNPQKIIDLALEYGLGVDVRQGMTIDDLIGHLDQEHPVLVLIQAWGEEADFEANYPRYDDGHYVVVVGYDRDNLYVEDPSLKGVRGVMKQQDFLERWHDEGRGKRYERWGAAFSKQHEYEEVKGMVLPSPFLYRVKGSYFGECERDDEGHCLPSGQAGEGASGEEKPKEEAPAPEPAPPPKSEKEQRQERVEASAKQMVEHWKESRQDRTYNLRMERYARTLDLTRKRVLATAERSERKLQKLQNQREAFAEEMNTAWTEQWRLTKELHAIPPEDEVARARKQAEVDDAGNKVLGFDEKFQAIGDAYQKELQSVKKRIWDSLRPTATGKISFTVGKWATDLGDRTDSQIENKELGKTVKAGAKWVEQMIGRAHYYSEDVGVGQIPATEEQRAHFKVREKIIALSPTDDAATFVHEAGHAIENLNSTVRRLVHGFLLKRVGEEAPTSLAEKFPDHSYRDHEFGREDGFGKTFSGSKAFYVGKHYYSGDTEVLSMGLEQIYRDPVHFARTDPEYFDLVVGILNGTLIEEYYDDDIAKESGGKGLGGRDGGVLGGRWEVGQREQAIGGHPQRKVLSRPFPFGGAFRSKRLASGGGVFGGRGGVSGATSGRGGNGVLIPPSPFLFRVKDLSYQNETAGGALVPPPEQKDGPPESTELERAKHSDLITLPDGIEGTNCGNCEYVTPEQHCIHPEVDQPVTLRMCCKYWDAPGTHRAWEQDGKKSVHVLLTKATGTCKPGQRSDLTGCQPAEGEAGTPPPKEGAEEKPKDSSSALRRLGSTSWDALKKAGHAIKQVEHAAKEWAEGKIKERIASLPPTLQKYVRGAWVGIRFGTKAAFATYTAGQKAAELVAQERGATPEEAQRLKAILSTIDIATFKPVSIVVGATATPAAAGAASFIPLGSMTYLAYSTARDPLATIRAARKAVRSITKKVTGEKAVQSDDRELLNKIHVWLGSGEQAEYRMALLLAALDETQDLRKAFDVAQRAGK